jgi:hypothetical protein
MASAKSVLERMINLNAAAATSRRSTAPTCCRFTWPMPAKRATSSTI